MANRGGVKYTEPTDVSVGEPIYADHTKYLLQVLMTVMNERDSINTIKANEDGYSKNINQLNGIANVAKKSEMEAIYNTIKPKETEVFASYINSIIKYTNEITSTFGKYSVKAELALCQFPYTAIIIKKEEQPIIPDMQKVDPITGVGLVDSSGAPIMVAGYKNPVPVLDASGNQTYYTVTHLPIYQEGPLTNVDKTDTVTLCGNPNIECPNRSKLYYWKEVSNAADPGFVYLCKNQYRDQAIYQPSTIATDQIKYVNKGDLIKASTFTGISKNLRAISEALDTYKTWWNTDGTCAKTCQVSCQRICMLACQSCHGGTCHDQNCGGFS